MSLARGLERRLERFVDGVAAKLFGGRLEPVELGTRLVREADLAVVQTDIGPVVPNHFVVRLDGDPDDTDAATELSDELASILEVTAAERGWRLEGPATVELVAETGKGATVTIDSATVVAPRPEWCQLIPSEGEPVSVRVNRAVIGRSATSDVHLAHDHVSRRHALLWREQDAVWVFDLESANGTTVNGHPVAETTEVPDGAVLGLGEARYALRAV